MSLDMEELAYLDKQIKQYEKEKMDEIKPDLIEIFKECVQEAYDSYQPIVWDRQYRLLNDIVTVDEDNGKVFLHENLSNAGYTSAVDGGNVDNMLDKFIFEGHHDGSGIDNMYHNFEPYPALQLAQQRIKEKYPDLDVQIVLSGQETL